MAAPRRRATSSTCCSLTTRTRQRGLQRARAKTAEKIIWRSSLSLSSLSLSLSPNARPFLRAPRVSLSASLLWIQLGHHSSHTHTHTHDPPPSLLFWPCCSGGATYCSPLERTRFDM